VKPITFGLTLEEAVRLHGHKGPWLVLGYKAGLRAREYLKPTTEHDMVCIVRVPKKTPYTCTIDGIQAAAGCTLGKLTISVEDCKDIELEFMNRVNGKKLVLRLRSRVRGIIEELSSKKGLEAGGAEWVEKAPLQELFEEIGIQ